MTTCLVLGAVDAVAAAVFGCWVVWHAVTELELLIRLYRKF